MEKGTVVLAFPSPVELDLASMADAAVESSHRLRTITLEVAGRFEGDGFVIDGTNRRFPVDLGGRTAPTGPAHIRAEIASWDRPVLRILEIR